MATLVVKYHGRTLPLSLPSNATIRDLRIALHVVIQIGSV